VVLLGLAFIQTVNDDAASQWWAIGLTDDFPEGRENENFHLYTEILLKNACVLLDSGGYSGLQIFSVLGQLVRDGCDEGGFPAPANRR
jgi:hypothetical protein